jgi:hypothetical protein
MGFICRLLPSLVRERARTESLIAFEYVKLRCPPADIEGFMIVDAHRQQMPNARVRMIQTAMAPRGITSISAGFIVVFIGKLASKLPIEIGGAKTGVVRPMCHSSSQRYPNCA